jgi:hypothetical protein
LFRNRKQKAIVELKAQDTLLAIKLWSLNKDDQQCGIREISELIGISTSEVSKGAKRLYTESGALLEWLSFGVRYAYPSISEGYGRGLATAWNCPVLSSEIVPPLPPFIWALLNGNTEGDLIKSK